MRPLQLDNPMTDAPIVTEDNQAYGRCTRHAEIVTEDNQAYGRGTRHAETAAEDEEYIHMTSAEAPIQQQPSIGIILYVNWSTCVLATHISALRPILAPFYLSIALTTENSPTEGRSLPPTTLQGQGLESQF